MVNEWIQQKSKGKTFADVGGLWGTVNERVSMAVKAGASSATMVDIQNLDHELWDKFKSRCAEQEVYDYKCIQADMTDISSVQKLGSFDVVHCSGILYHLPDPLILLQHLRSITNEYLFFGTTTIPEQLTIEEETLVTHGGKVYFIPALNLEQKLFFGKHFSNEGLKIANINGPEVKWYLENGKPDFGPWWWLFTKEYVLKLLELEGFEVIDVYENWPNKAHMFLCKKL